MSMLGIGQEPTIRGTGILDIPKGLDRPAVIITGSCSESEFVAAKVLICADTQAAEVAIRAWLEVRGIRTTG